ncbi:hypothetical protein [Leifsonia sp. NPDC080035]|uniref:Integral membrane protein n=1 Tax=Leifsonia sp. NPDC080035 TaxID=3143936 RepID=A0AAU7GHZ4_9MICO
MNDTLAFGGPFMIVAAIACPLVAAILLVAFRRPIARWLAGIVPQKNVRKVRAAVLVAALAVAAFVAGWILAVLVPGAPPPLSLSVLGVAALAWLVAWALLANEQ